MSQAENYLVRTRDLDDAEGMRVRHPLNPASSVLMHPLGQRVGMQRVQLALARVPPGKESFVPHAHGLQEEFLFILEGEGKAIIGDDEVTVGPGDYLGFPTDGTAHHLVNDGEADLVYLMGGERTSLEFTHFPTHGKVGVMRDGGVLLFDEDQAQVLDQSDWAAED